ncbi:hypothetical protein B0H14DRAFT_2346642 [Mycena olivaceomarginata]|nr:hypothetical protein B0H14DRAFT_2346642 [Mycena olivaceomarginata]
MDDVLHFLIHETTHAQHQKDRQTNETHISYSRLDRICVVNQRFKMYRAWEIKHCSVKSDRRLAMTQLTCIPDEQPGHGRWSMPLYLLKTPKFMKRVQALAAQLRKDLEGLQLSEHDPTNNIQTLWAKFKLDIIT